MAVTFKLSRSGESDLSLVSAHDAGIRSRKWYPKMGEIPAEGIPPYVTEEIDVVADASSDDNLAIYLRDLDEYRKWAAIYEVDDALWYPVLLNAKMDDETYTRVAHVRKISGEWRSNQLGAGGEAQQHMAQLRLRIERHPYWEDPSENAIAGLLTGLGVPTWAILYDYTSGVGDIVGSVDARLMFAISEVTGTVQVDRIWAGIRSTRHGDPSNFHNIWEIEDVDTTAGTDCGAPAADANASPGGVGNTVREVDFATQTGWYKRWEGKIFDYTTDYVDCLGRFLWLFRGCIDTGTVCEVQLRFGHEGSPDADWLQGPIFEVANDDYDIYEGGQSQFPVATMNAYTIGHQAVWHYRSAAVQIWARRTSGAGSLWLDALAPIPVDEGWLIASNVLSSGLGGTGTMRAWQTEYDKQIVKTTKNSAPYAVHIPNWSAKNFMLPPGDGRIAMVVAGTSDSDMGGRYSIGGYAVPRWANLRGNNA